MYSHSRANVWIREIEESGQKLLSLLFENCLLGRGVFLWSDFWRMDWKSKVEALMLETPDTKYVGREETHSGNKIESLSWIYTYFNTDYVEKIEQWFYSLRIVWEEQEHIYGCDSNKGGRNSFVFTHDTRSSIFKTTCPFPAQGHALLEPVTIGWGWTPPLDLLCKWFPVHHGQKHSHS